MSSRVHSWTLVAVLASLACGCVAQQHRPLAGTMGSTSQRSADEQLVRARLLEHKGNLQAATKAYQSILKSEPEYAAAHHRLGVLAARNGRHEEAQRHFEQALDAGASSSELLADMGYNYFLQGRLADAEDTLHEAVAKNPANRRARNNLGIVLGLEGRVEESLAQFQQAVGNAKGRENLASIQSAGRHSARVPNMDWGPMDESPAPTTVEGQSMMAQARHNRHEDSLPLPNAPANRGRTLDDAHDRDANERVHLTAEKSGRQPAQESNLDEQLAQVVFAAPPVSAFSQLPQETTDREFSSGPPRHSSDRRRAESAPELGTDVIENEALRPGPGQAQLPETVRETPPMIVARAEDDAPSPPADEAMAEWEPVTAPAREPRRVTNRQRADDATVAAPVRIVSKRRGPVQTEKTHAEFDGDLPPTQVEAAAPSGNVRATQADMPSGEVMRASHVDVDERADEVAELPVRTLPKRGGLILPKPKTRKRSE